MRHVLVIEDQYLFAQLVADIALVAGASSVAIAENEEAAVELARNHRPWLILSDLKLRNGRGTSAVERIRAACGPVPTIYITAWPDDLHTDNGPAAIIRKPITVDQLTSVFDTMVAQIPPNRVACH
ncbi:response regulator [Sphingomonas sp.]|uniref:response regulator n=1 Tax=Sphingomonas sp. TaxID=28214 RepID=UPI0035C7E9F2